MAIQINRFGARAQMTALGMVLGLVFASTAWGQSDAERKAVIAKVAIRGQSRRRSRDKAWVTEAVTSWMRADW